MCPKGSEGVACSEVPTRVDRRGRGEGGETGLGVKPFKPTGASGILLVAVEIRPPCRASQSCGEGGRDKGRGELGGGDRLSLAGRTMSSSFKSSSLGLVGCSISVSILAIGCVGCI